MKKEALLRGLLGVPLGIALGHIISLLASLGLAGGEFSPCVPSLVQAMGSEVAAVALQTGLSGLLGAAFGAGSVVWSLDHWSLVKQTGVYFLIGSLAMLPIAYLAHWMEHSLRGILGYFLIYLAIFAGIWAIQYLTWRRRIGKLNQKLEYLSPQGGSDSFRPACLPLYHNPPPVSTHPKNSRTVRLAKKNPARSAHRAAGTA